MPYGRLARALVILWFCSLVLVIGALGVETLLHVHVSGRLFIGPALVASLPLFFVVTPGFSAPPYLGSAALFSAAVMWLAATLHSLVSGEPAFGNAALAAGLAIILALVSAWFGRLLWRAFA